MEREEIRAVMRGLATHAQGYQNLFDKSLQEFDLSKQNLLQADVKKALKFIYAHFAFARAGGERAGYSDIAALAVDDFSGTKVPLSNQLWERFKERCRGKGIKPNEKLTKGVVEGIASLADKQGNLFLWMGNEIRKSGELEPLLLEFTKLKGISVKIASFIIRDTVWLWGLEKRVRPKDKLYLQPIDRWVRRIAKILWPKFNREKEVNELIIAKRISEACESFDMSNVEFNQGAWYFASQEVRDENKLGEALKRLVVR